MKIKILTVVALAAIAAGALSLSEPAVAAKEKFQRSKSTTPGAAVGQPAGKKQPLGPKGGRQIKRSNMDLVFKQPYPNGPLVGAPMSGYCGSNQGGGVAKSVVVAVKNNGSETVGHFMVKVTFVDAYTSLSRAYGPINPGPAADIDSWTIPNSAWKHGMARFTVEIDSDKQISEGVAGEANNYMEGYCVAPAG